MDNWVKVYASASVQQAEIIRLMLAQEHIEAVVLNKKDSAYQLFGEVELYVPRLKAEYARALINATALS